MTTTKRLQHRKAVLSRILDELHRLVCPLPSPCTCNATQWCPDFSDVDGGGVTTRTSLHKEIEKGIQGVVQDPSSAFHTLAHAQINDALESMRSSAGTHLFSFFPPPSHSLGECWAG
jgi:hypothetical protein